MNEEVNRNNLTDLLAMNVVFVASLIVFSFDTSGEFQGDDDYSVSMRAAGIANIFRTFDLEGIHRILGAFAINLDFNLINLRHGAFPLFYEGLMLRLFDAAGIGFTVPVIHLPFAIVGAVCCVMLFAVLRRMEIGRTAALLATSLLMFSPLFSMGARGVATYYMVVPVFTSLLAILAVFGPLDTLRRRAFASFAIFNLLLGETLFFLTLPALLAAIAVAGALRGERLVSLREAVARSGNALAPLGHPVIVVPNAMALAAVIQSTIDFYRLAPDKFGLVRFGSLITKHTESGAPIIAQPGLIYDYLGMVAGELFPIALLVMGGMIVFVRPRKAFDATTIYAIVAGVGFVTLFYGLVPASGTVKNYYQSYVIVPLLLLFAICLDRLSGALSQIKWMRPTLAIVGILTLASCIGGHIAFVWHNPALVMRPSAFAELTHGSNHPNLGAKAIGGLTRSFLERHAASGKRHPIHYYVERRHLDAAPFGTTTSLQVFAGVLTPIVKNFDYPFEIRVKDLENDAASERRFECRVYHCAELDLRSPSTKETTPSVFYEYVILGDQGTRASRPIARLAVQADAPMEAIDPPPGEYLVTKLDMAFDAKHDGFGDYLPHAPYNNN